MNLYILEFTPESLQDIGEAANYYESKRKGLGKRFRREVKRKLNSVKESPLIYAVRYNAVHVAFTETFPYSIHFKILEDIKIIQVFAILCQYRNPDEFWIK